MRCGAVTMLVLVLGLAACGKGEKAEPAPAEVAYPTAEASVSTETPAGTATERAATAALPEAASATPSPVVPGKFNALGTEPFWNARVDGAALTYTTPEDENGKRITVERRDTAIGAVFSGTLDGAPLILTMTRRTCSDGMSDREYPFRTVLTIGTQRRVGCAS